MTGITPTRLVLICISAILATVMQTLDSTIANVALPHMQGSMGATQDQISWVLTSYVVGVAMAISLTAFLAERYGRTRIFVLAVIGFTIASMLCGAAQTLPQIVAFRLMQGVCSAGLIPLSQSVLMDMVPRERQGPVVALWGMGVMIGPVAGPTIGGYLTELYSWRWVFYINLPFGIISALGLATFLPETPRNTNNHFDGTGFAFLAVALAALQLMLDRGQSLDWFDSREIIVEAAVAGLCFYLFVVHMFTAPQPFLDPQLFRDLNFVTGLVLMLVLGMVLLSTMALLPTMLQNLMHYPVSTAGMLMAPRGLGMMAGMFLIGRVGHRVDVRVMVLVGFGLMTYSLWLMAGFSLDVSEKNVITTGVMQGIGMGMIFVSLNTVCFATMESRHLTSAAALYNLVRNIGSSIGIAVTITLLAQNTQINHSVLAESITAFSHVLRGFAGTAVNAISRSGVAMLEGEVSRQAAMTAYADDYLLMSYVALAVAPLVLLIKPGKGRSGAKVAAAEA